MVYGVTTALAAALFFAWNGVFVQKGVRNASPQHAVFITILVNTVVYAAVVVVLALMFTLPAINALGLIHFAAAAVTAPILGRTFQYRAIQLIGVSRTNSVKLVDAAFGVLLGFIAFGEIPRLFSVVGMVLVIGGIWLLCQENPKAPKLSNNRLEADSAESSAVSRASSSGSSFSVDACLDASGLSEAGTVVTKSVPLSKPGSEMSYGYLIGILSGFSFAVANMFRKLGLMEIPSPVLGSALSSAFALLFYLGLAASRGRVSSVFSMNRQSLNDFIWAGIVMTIAWFFQFYTLTFIDLSLAIVLQDTTPFWAMLLARLFLKSEERVTLRLIFTSIMVFSGVLFMLLLGTA